MENMNKPKGNVSYRKIKVKESGEITVVYEILTDGANDDLQTVTYVSREQPLPDFYFALEAMTTFICRKYDVAGVITDSRLQELTLKELEEKTDAAFLLNVRGEHWGIDCKISEKNISSDTQTQVNNFLYEVQRFIEGERAQSSLF